MWCCLQTFADGVVSKLKLDSHILQVILRRENTSIFLLIELHKSLNFGYFGPRAGFNHQRSE